MKLVLGAIALMFAVPAFAQAAPTADPHAGHTMPADHKDRPKKEHDCKACCQTMKKDGEAMECMDGKKPAADDDAKAPDHAGHDH